MWIGSLFHLKMRLPFFFPENKAVLVGNPRAQEVADTKKIRYLKTFDLDPEKKTVLILAVVKEHLKSIKQYQFFFF